MGWRLDYYHHHEREHCYYCSHSLASAASNIPEISGWGPLSSSKFSSSSPRRCCSLRKKKKKKQISSSSPKKKDRTPTMKKKEENAPRHRRRYSPELRACRIRILRPSPPRLGPLSSLSLFFLCARFFCLSFSSFLSSGTFLSLKRNRKLFVSWENKYTHTRTHIQRIYASLLDT